MCQVIIYSNVNQSWAWSMLLVRKLTIVFICDGDGMRDNTSTTLFSSLTVYLMVKSNDMILTNYF